MAVEELITKLHRLSEMGRVHKRLKAWATAGFPNPETEEDKAKAAEREGELLAMEEELRAELVGLLVEIHEHFPLVFSLAEEAYAADHEDQDDLDDDTDLGDEEEGDDDDA